MKAQAPGGMQRASRTRIAVALCVAGLVTGTLSSSLVGAGADNPPPVPGESVAAPPTQVAATETSTTETTPAAPASDAAAAAAAAQADAPQAASAAADASTTPAVSEPATPAPAARRRPPRRPPRPRRAPPAPRRPPPPRPPPRRSPHAAPAPATATATATKPETDPQPLGGLAGAPQAPAARPCPRTQPLRRSGRRRLVAGAKIALTASNKPISRVRAAVACEAPAAKKSNTAGRTKSSVSRTTDRDDADRKILRNDQGVPTLSNPSTSLALPGPAPIGVPNFFIDKFRIPVFLLPIYQAAGIQYGVRWEVLAAINEIETDYGRNLNVSSAGALGWMQFMPATWKAYGVDANRDGRKDPFNPVDAIFAAARYLKAAGADDDLRKAIFAYNHADWYVESVLMRARLIGGMPSDLVGSLSGLTQGHFPVFAKARYADDLSERSATRRVKLGTNVAMPVEADATRRGIDIFAAAGSPVIAVQDGRIVSVGTSKRLGSYVKMRDVYGNTYTYSQLKKVATKIPVPKDKTQSKASIAKELALPKADPKPTHRRQRGPAHEQAPVARPADAEGRRQAEGRRRAQGAAVRPPEPPERAEARRRPPAPRAGVDPCGRRKPQVLLHGCVRPRRGRRRAPAARRREPGHRRHGPRPHRDDVRARRAARALRDPPRGSRRAADRPQADPRRLEAARGDRDLPREGPQPAGRRRCRQRVDRTDPADEQGGARSSASSRTRGSTSTPAAAATSRPAASTGACSRRSSSSRRAGCGRR